MLKNQTTQEQRYGTKLLAAFCFADAHVLQMISKVCSRIAIVLQPVWYRLGEGVYSREELDRMSQELIDIYANFPSGTHNLLNVITGCKKVE